MAKKFVFNHLFLRISPWFECQVMNKKNIPVKLFHFMSILLFIQVYFQSSPSFGLKHSEHSWLLFMWTIIGMPSGCDILISDQSSASNSESVLKYSDVHLTAMPFPKFSVQAFLISNHGEVSLRRRNAYSGVWLKFTPCSCSSFMLYFPCSTSERSLTADGQLVDLWTSCTLPHYTWVERPPLTPM